MELLAEMFYLLVTIWRQATRLVHPPELSIGFLFSVVDDCTRNLIAPSLYLATPRRIRLYTKHGDDVPCAQLVRHHGTATLNDSRAIVGDGGGSGR